MVVMTEMLKLPMVVIGMAVMAELVVVTRANHQEAVVAKTPLTATKESAAGPHHGPGVAAKTAKGVRGNARVIEHHQNKSTQPKMMSALIHERANVSVLPAGTRTNLVECSLIHPLPGNL